MPKKIVKTYRTGVKGKYEGLFKTVKTEYDLQSDVDNKLCKVWLNTANEQSDPAALLQTEAQQFKTYLDSKGIDSDYHASWIELDDGSVVKLQATDSVSQYDDRGVRAVMMIHTYVARSYPKDYAAYSAAEGLIDIFLAEKSLADRDYKMVAVHSINAMRKSRKLAIQIMESQWHVGQTRLDTLIIEKYTPEERSEVQVFIQSKIDARPNLSAAYRDASDHFNIPVDTMKDWVKKGKITIKRN